MYNSYGYNPYNRYATQPLTAQPMEMSMQPQTTPQMALNRQNILYGKQVDNLEVVKATDIPLDGSISYFPLTDNSAIVTKQIGLDGKSKMTVYKPILDEEEQNKYITPEELKKAIDNIDLSEIDDIKEELKDIKKKLKKNGVKDE